MVEECESRGEGFEMFGNDSSADLDDSELLEGNRAKVGEVLLDLSFGANVAEQLDDRGTSREAV